MVGVPDYIGDNSKRAEVLALVGLAVVIYLLFVIARQQGQQTETLEWQADLAEHNARANTAVAQVLTNEVEQPAPEADGATDEEVAEAVEDVDVGEGQPKPEAAED